MVAGLPNILGSGGNTDKNNFSGAIYGDSSKSNGFDGFLNSKGAHIYFDASKSNDLYGKSSTVTPLSRKCKYFIKY